MALKLLVLFLVINFTAIYSVEGKIMKECDAFKELEAAKIQRVFIAHWICLMQHVSKMKTDLITQHGGPPSVSYGIFQINNFKWCRSGIKGGKCNEICEHFLNDDIKDDIKCALKIFEEEGFKSWPEWVTNCKGKVPPFNIQQCEKKQPLLRIFGH